MQQQRAIILAAATPTVLRGDRPTRVAVVAGAVSSTQFDLDAGAVAVDDVYNGLDIDFVKGPGAGLGIHLITDYAGATTKRVTVTPALPVQPTTATTFRIGPSLPPAHASFLLGNATGNVTYSFREGGTAAGMPDQFILLAGQTRLFSWSEGLSRIDVLELLSAGGDTIFIEFT